MSILTLAKKLEKQENETMKTKNQLCDEINLFIKPIFSKEVHPSYNIRISERLYKDMDWAFPFNNMNCIEIVEDQCDDTYDHWETYCFPTYFLKLDKKLLKQEHNKLIELAKIENKKRQTKYLEDQEDKIKKNERKTYLKLKKKYG